MLRFGYVLKKLRLSANLSQSGLQQRSGVSRFTISQYENDRINMQLPKLIKLANGLGIEAWKILRYVEREYKSGKLDI